MSRERVRYQILLLVVSAANVMALTALHPTGRMLLLIGAVEVLVSFVPWYVVGPRLFPSVFAEDPIYAALRSGAPRRVLAVYLAGVVVWTAGWLALVFGPPLAVTLALLRWLVPGGSEVSRSLVMLLIMAVWLVHIVAMLAFRAPLRRWADSRMPKLRIS